MKLTMCLNYLFEEIDLNNDGRLEWDEFLNYILDKANKLAI